MARLWPLAALLALACLSPHALADGETDADVLWVVADAVEEGSARVVYFCGRTPLPNGTKVDVFLRRKGNISKAARAIVGQKTPYYHKARMKLGARAEGVNFGGLIGPIPNMVLGEWDLLFMARVKGKRHKTVYPLLVGNVAEALDQERTEAERLTRRVDELEEHYKQAKALFTEYAERKTWDQRAEDGWAAKAGPMILALQQMSNQALGERAKVLAPVFPFVQMVLTQMPLKLKDLIFSHRALYRERGGKTKQPSFSREAANGRIDEEIVRHIRLARERLTARDSTSMAAFFLDVTKLENLVGELDRQNRRARNTSRFDAALWNSYADSAVRHVEVFRKRLGRYREGSEVAQAAPEVLDKLDEAVGMFEQLVDRFSSELYSKHRTAQVQRREAKTDGGAGAHASGKALRKALAQRVTEIRAFAEQERTKMREELLARYDMLRRDLLGFLQAAQSGAEAYAGFATPVVERLERQKYTPTRESRVYFPDTVSQLAVFNRNVRSLVAEQRDMFTLGAKGTTKVRGVEIEYDRAERLVQMGNGALRTLAALCEQLGRRDTQVASAVAAWVKRRGGKPDAKALARIQAVEDESAK